MLLQIRDYIQREQVVSTQQLAREFQVDELALQPMLSLWVDKGVIGLCQDKAACQSSCFQCSTKAPQFYQFIAD